MKDIIYRIDDIGASTKYYNQHGKTFGFFPFANFWFLKRIWPFRGWAKYDELTVEEWVVILDNFEKNKIVPIIAVTATWVNHDSTQIPFPKKFPDEAEILKKAYLNNKVIIANHGLTHCVVGKHLPLFWGSNRHYHREFLPELDQKLHTEHILKSQEILEGFFGKPVSIFVPPGNIWSYKTYLALKGTNIKTVMCSKHMADSDQKIENISFVVDKDNSVAFHDRELKLYGIEWLENLINKNI